MKILILCHGNICRSTMAEGILKNKLLKNNIKNVYVESAGFEPYHVGDAPDNRTLETLNNHNIVLKNKKARLFIVEDFDIFDFIYYMDENNRNYVKSFARNQKDLSKTDFIMNSFSSGKNQEVPDPYYGGKDGFNKVYALLDIACDSIIEKIIHNDSR